MRLWLKDSQRRPDPDVVATDDRKAILFGIIGWLAGFAVLLVFVGPLVEAGNGWWLITCGIGVGLGLLGLVYTSRRR